MISFHCKYFAPLSYAVYCDFTFLYSILTNSFFFFCFLFYLGTTYSPPNSQIRSSLAPSSFVCVCVWCFSGSPLLACSLLACWLLSLLYSCWLGIVLCYHVGNSWVTCLLNSISLSFVSLRGALALPSCFLRKKGVYEIVFLPSGMCKNIT